jgi:hypothetical protein
MITFTGHGRLSRDVQQPARGRCPPSFGHEKDPD